MAEMRKQMAFGLPAQPDPTSTRLPPIQSILDTLPRDQQHLPPTPTCRSDDRYSSASPTDTSMPWPGNEYRGSQYEPAQIVKRRKMSMLEGYSPAEPAPSRGLRDPQTNRSNVPYKCPSNGPLDVRSPHNWASPSSRGQSNFSSSYPPPAVVPLGSRPSTGYQPPTPNGLAHRAAPPTAPHNFHSNGTHETLPLHNGVPTQRPSTASHARQPRPEDGFGYQAHHNRSSINHEQQYNGHPDARYNGQPTPLHNGPLQVVQGGQVVGTGAFPFVHSANSSDGQPVRRRRGNLPKAATNQLKEWFDAHKDSPYPTEEQKQMLVEHTQLSLNQVSNWFINARRRRPAAEARLAAKLGTASLANSAENSPEGSPGQ